MATKKYHGCKGHKRGDWGGNDVHHAKGRSGAKLRSIVLQRGDLEKCIRMAMDVLHRKVTVPHVAGGKGTRGSGYVYPLMQTEQPHVVDPDVVTERWHRITAPSQFEAVFCQDAKKHKGWWGPAHEEAETARAQKLAQNRTMEIIGGVHMKTEN